MKQARFEHTGSTFYDGRLRFAIGGYYC